uniref:ATP-binding protein n=1 Tax=Paractinoplanes polyasparticus TaxID=2856853 RepID=UPI001C8448FB|nr:DUF87 domain-containing protein [Actinoplanes polyasparticus]
MPERTSDERESGTVLQAAGGHVTWCWVGVRIEAAADLTETREYADLPERGRLVKAVAAEAAWIAGQWDDAYGTRFDLRYVSSPGAGLSCALLARVQGCGPHVVEAAVRLRERLAVLPRHVHASQILDPAEVRRFLIPFRPGPGGLAEIRKRVRLGDPQRPDAGVQHYLAVEPFTVAAPDWEPVWRAMAAQLRPTVLSIALEPYRVPAGTGRGLQSLATEYGRLAMPGRTPDGLFTEGVPLAPDTFATDAAKLYADAARRYTGHAYRTRISIASAGRLDHALPELVAAAVSPPQQAREQGPLTETFTGPAYVVVRPAAHEVETARRNLTTLDLRRWDAEHTGRLPVDVPAVVRLLADLVDAREASAALRLPLAVHGHMPGFPVRRPGIALEAEYRPRGPQVTLGRQLVGDQMAGPLGVALNDLTRHALVVGTTGSGKTNSMLTFCEQLWRDHRIPFLVLEPVNTTLDDYRWLATRPGMEELLVLTVGNERVAPLRLNPFEVPPGVRISAHIAGLLACFDAAFGLWDPLPHIYNRALRETYTKRNIVISDTAGPPPAGGWPTLRDFVARLREQTSRLAYAGDLKSNIQAASVLRAESLAENACGSTVDVARSYPIFELLRRPVVVELAAIGDNEKELSLITALLLQVMTEYYKAGAETGGLAHVTVVEEAHRLLGRPPDRDGATREGNAQARAAASFANMLAENRKYGEGLVIVEQVPGKLVEDAYKNTNLKVMHRLPAEDDRRLIGGTMRFSDDQRRYAGTLAPFTAFAYHDAIDRPALIQVPDVRGEAARTTGRAHAPLASDAELAVRFRAFADDHEAVAAATAPFPDCDGCAHRCLFRGRAATAAASASAAAFRERIRGYPKQPADWPDWWTETIRATSALAARTGTEALTPAQQRDYEACVFLHQGRRAWRDGAPKWVSLYRRNAGAVS